MGDKTGIEWTDATWNPIAGCSLVSRGCTNCYAMKQAHRIQHMNGPDTHYFGTTRVVKGTAVWTGTVKVAPDHIFLAPLRWKKPRRIFVNSMSDLFHEGVPDEIIDRVFATMARCPQHTFQILTKRPDRMRSYALRRAQISAQISTDDAYWLEEWETPYLWPLPNVWLGVSVEDQPRADERIPLLLATPAAVRWISAEPLLGSLYLTRIRVTDLGWHDVLNGWRECKDYAGREHLLDWVVAGGESGPDARPMHPDWARSLRDQCVAAGVPFLFKQWGEYHPEDQPNDVPGEDWANIANYDDGSIALRVGKKRAGRLLDGRTWDQYPEVPA